jgi:formylglycine-generating enzyme required for sulfatase activity
VSVTFYYDGKQISQVSATATIASAVPVITSLVPNVGWADDTVKIKGTNFGADKTKGTVTFSSGVVATQIISWIDTMIVVKVPQGTQSGPVTVMVNSFTSNAVAFTIPTAVSDLLAVAGGSFQMGQSPGPIGQSPGHAVTIGPFKIDKYEITYEKWTEVRNWGLTHGYTDLTSAQNGAAPVSANNPVTMVSWYQIMRWCNARSEKDGMTPVYYTSNSLTTVYRTGVLDVKTDQVKWTANGYRLPTEAEWEFAARGGKTGTNVYSGSNTLGDVAWYHDNAGSRTHQVGTKSPNELGIYDMTGNVYEWCWDFYGEYATGAQTDPKGPVTGTNHVVRGGSYIDYDYGCPLVTRYSEYPSTSAPILGFRCVQH